MDFIFNPTMGEKLSIWMVLLRIAMSLLIGVIIGVDREKRNRPAGLRTHALVCLGATIVSLVEQQMVANVVALGNSQINVSVGRLTAGVVSGVGFLGAGTIIMTEKKLTGLTTAASLWCTACIGVAVGAGYIVTSLLACIIVLAVLRTMQKIVRVNSCKKLEVQYVHKAETLPFIEQYFADNGVKVLDVDFHSEARDNGWLYTTVYTLSIPSSITLPQLITPITEYKNVKGTITRNV